MRTKENGRKKSTGNSNNTWQKLMEVGSYGTYGRRVLGFVQKTERNERFNGGYQKATK